MLIISSRERDTYRAEKKTRHQTFCVVQHLMQSFKLIAAVPERSDRVHVEGVLSLTYCSDSLFQPRQVHLLVGLPAVVWREGINRRYRVNQVLNV